MRALSNVRDSPAMKIFLINVFGTLFVFVAHEPGVLSRRLASLRDWPAHRNRVARQ